MKPDIQHTQVSGLRWRMGTPKHLQWGTSPGLGWRPFLERVISKVGGGGRVPAGAHCANKVGEMVTESVWGPVGPLCVWGARRQAGKGKGDPTVVAPDCREDGGTRSWMWGAPGTEEQGLEIRMKGKSCGGEVRSEVKQGSGPGDQG